MQVSGTQPALTQTRLVQVSSAAHPPQSRLRPQPSPIVLQYLPLGFSQVTALQLVPPTQMLPSQLQSPEHDPHSTALPQLSPILPQYLAPTGLQEAVPQVAAPAEPLVPPLPIRMDVVPPNAVVVVAPPTIEDELVALVPPTPVVGVRVIGSPDVAVQLQREPSNSVQAIAIAGTRTMVIRLVTARTFPQMEPRERVATIALPLRHEPRPFPTTCRPSRRAQLKRGATHGRLLRSSCAHEDTPEVRLRWLDLTRSRTSGELRSINAPRPRLDHRDCQGRTIQTGLPAAPQSHWEH